MGSIPVCFFGGPLNGDATMEAIKFVKATHAAPIDRQPPEKLLTIKQAADAIGIRYWLLLRAVNRGDIPHYRFGNERRRVRLSDIEAIIQAARVVSDQYGG
jgi:excisionase family DNA binding protein